MNSSGVGHQFVMDFLRERRPDIGPLDPNLDLIESRIISSMMFVEFLYRLEEKTGQEINLEDVVPEDFRTINKIEARFFS
ncbi:acyl carrier protein [Mycobacteroides immunogenum]|uniref:acyl carrier protein n=1 Tax=Mycobacteroides immunogenum TaxID=83262 RepID=UPI0025B7A6D1|nr:acyl carrier protein [Mycobacteroides immunogenum]WJR33243.1 acyl carrier protein [Mycobacteroides immunogenum]